MKEYWKNKRHVIYFIALAVCFLTTMVLFILDAINYSQHQEEYNTNGSPLTIAAIISLFIFLIVAIFCLVNLIVFFYKNKPHKNKDQIS